MNRQNLHNWLQKNTAALIAGAAVLLLLIGGFWLMNSGNGEEVPSKHSLSLLPKLFK